MLGRLTLNPLAHIDWIGTVLFPLIAFSTGAPLLGWAKPVPVNFHNLRAPRRDFAIVAAAGPISNLVLASAGTLAFYALGGFAARYESFAAGFMADFVVINVMLAVFNMIPVPPLDGGNVLSGFVPENVAQLIDRVRPYGFIILYALLLTGVLARIVHPIAQVIFSVLGFA